VSLEVEKNGRRATGDGRRAKSRRDLAEGDTETLTPRDSLPSRPAATDNPGFGNRDCGRIGIVSDLAIIGVLSTTIDAKIVVKLQPLLLLLRVGGGVLQNLRHAPDQG
jgi:hypothetical protein